MTAKKSCSLKQLPQSVEEDQTKNSENSKLTLAKLFVNKNKLKLNNSQTKSIVGGGGGGGETKSNSNPNHTGHIQYSHFFFTADSPGNYLDFSGKNGSGINNCNNLSSFSNYYNSWNNN